MSMTKARPVKDPSYAKRYGPYDPFTVACMRQANLQYAEKFPGS